MKSRAYKKLINNNLKRNSWKFNQSLNISIIIIINQLSLQSYESTLNKFSMRSSGVLCHFSRSKNDLIGIQPVNIVEIRFLNVADSEYRG